MNKKNVRDKAFNFLGSLDKKIKTKLDNVCGKTGQYNVPNELFQKRTHRRNRALISWQTVKNNNLTLDQLETFTGGIVVEFINNDFFDKNNQKNNLFLELQKRLGCDQVVSSMISIRNEDGKSSSSIQRESFEKLKKELPDYQQKIIRRKNNVSVSSSGVGNDKWEGFIYVSIRGGQQDTEMTHKEDVNYLLFNPACEFANSNVCLDIDLIMAYFALFSIKNELPEKEQADHLKTEIEEVLKEQYYENDHFVGNLLDYCLNHPSLRMAKGKLYDTIQVEEISIYDFAIDNKADNKNIDFTHDEAVNKGKYYWDKKQKCILTPSRPTNVFWSKHLSNMMQQNFSLEEYYIFEGERVEKRKRLL